MCFNRISIVHYHKEFNGRTISSKFIVLRDYGEQLDREIDGFKVTRTLTNDKPRTAKSRGELIY